MVERQTFSSKLPFSFEVELFAKLRNTISIIFCLRGKLVFMLRADENV